MSLNPTDQGQIVKLQEDLTQALRSWDALNLANIVQWRKLRLQAEVDASAIYAAPRTYADGTSSTKTGLGILVEMPEVLVDHAAAPGPDPTLSVTIAILEEPNLNMAAETGTLFDAETIGLLVLAFAHRWWNETHGELYAQKSAMVPADEWPGLVAYRVRLGIRLTPAVLERVSAPAINEEALTVELETETEGAAIYYTTDESFPGSGNADAVLYSDPFTVEAGTVLRWAAYKTGMLPSAMQEATINS